MLSVFDKLKLIRDRGAVRKEEKGDQNKAKTTRAALWSIRSHEGPGRTKRFWYAIVFKGSSIKRLLVPFCDIANGKSLCKIVSKNLRWWDVRRYDFRDASRKCEPEFCNHFIVLVKATLIPLSLVEFAWMSSVCVLTLSVFVYVVRLLCINCPFFHLLRTNRCRIHLINLGVPQTSHANSLMSVLG